MLNRILGLALSLFLLLPISRGEAAETPQTGRTWTYLNLTVLKSPHLAWGLQPGHRLEFIRTSSGGLETPKGTFLLELFAGPILLAKAGPVQLKLPLFYYYMGFPVGATDDYFSSHSLEVVPIAEYQWKRLRLSNRVIFHNTFYSTFYEGASLRWGYSCLMREMLTLSLKLDKSVTVALGDEIFIGLAEDRDAVPAGPGFARAGFSENRLYLGPLLRLGRALTASPQYVYDTQYDSSGALVEVEHYFFLTLAYTLDRRSGGAK